MYVTGKIACGGILAIPWIWERVAEGGAIIGPIISYVMVVNDQIGCPHPRKTVVTWAGVPCH